MRFVQQIGGRVRKHRDARRAQCALVGGKALAAAKQDTKIIVFAGAHAILAAHGKAGLDHFGNAPGNGRRVAVHIRAVDDVDLAHTAVAAVLAAHNKALAVAVLHAAQPLREEGLKQVVDALDDAGRTAEVCIQRQRGGLGHGLRIGLPLLLFAHKNTGIRQTEAVDALLDIADKEQVVGLGPGQRKVDGVLQSVCVLVLVHQYGGVAGADRAAERRALVVLGQQKIQRQVLIIGVVQYFFSALGRKAVVGEGLRRPHQRGHQGRGAAAVGSKLISCAEQRVLAQALHLLFGAVTQFGCRACGLVGVLAALDRPGPPPARKDRVQRGQALVPVAFGQPVAEIAHPGRVVLHDGCVGGIGFFVPGCNGRTAFQQRFCALGAGQRNA